MVKIYSLDEFNELYDTEQKKRRIYVKKVFKLEKTKVLKKRVTATVVENGIPSIVVVSPAITKKAPDTNAFQALIMAYLKTVHGFKCRRISSEGRWRRDKSLPEGGKFIPGLNKGMEDIQAIGPGGRIIAIEAKFTQSDRMRDKQLEREQDILSSGGIYIRAKNFETFQRDLLKALGITHF
jgi:hypothetical protein